MVGRLIELWKKEKIDKGRETGRKVKKKREEA